MSTNAAQLADVLMSPNDLDATEDSVEKMLKKMNDKDYAGVKELYDNMGDKLKANRTVQFTYISACRKLDPALYQQALEHYALMYPDGGSPYQLLIDVYYLKKEYEKGIADIDKLDKIVGGDPALDFFRAIFCLLLNKHAEALAYFENVYRYDPSITANTVKLAYLFAEAGEKEKAKKVIEGYKKTLTYRAEDLDALYRKYPDLK
jgi:uncharacterized protein HemY